MAGCSRSEVIRSELSPLAARVLSSTASAQDNVGKRPAATDDSILVNAPAPLLAFAAIDTVADELKEEDRPAPMNGLCPADMASIDDRFCVDKYEASLVEMLPGGEERPYPFYMRVEGHKVRAVSQKGVYPQGYISGTQAANACKASGKRLCKPQEWRTACKGPEKQTYGYGKERKPGTCNDNGRSPIGFYWAANIADGTAFSSNKIMNDPQLNQLPGTLAETGSHEGCTNGYGVHDMVGNIHEWVDDPAGTFQGGYYLDVEKNGDGCGYRTDAHEVWYHDYSTGFRCCADVAQ
ncbi:MAG: SUMF1/EgtB/PvdO family nonheme iron enzyme [Labilithrix sp.]|nr:SUMF1/EgtB/PvdO family nonheme iron enzyme [Labilithrix sp.]MCW5816491.1 SUMF1/EgtB/PvdO family nonheme iron enzyme [Labilithrix sp.]